MFGHTIIGYACDGDEAISKFNQFEIKPDLIIMDHRIPFKDGIETMKEILQIDSSLKILFASADYQIKNVALNAGATSFKEKPFDLKRLNENIIKALNK